MATAAGAGPPSPILVPSTDPVPSRPPVPDDAIPDAARLCPLSQLVVSERDAAAALARAGFTPSSARSVVNFVVHALERVPKGGVLRDLARALRLPSLVGERLRGTLLMTGGLGALLNTLGKLHGVGARGGAAETSASRRPSSEAAKEPKSRGFGFFGRRSGRGARGRGTSSSSSSRRGFARGTGYSSGSSYVSDAAVAKSELEHRQRAHDRNCQSADVLDVLLALLEQLGEPGVGSPPTALSTVLVTSPLLPVLEASLRFADGADLVGAALATVSFNAATLGRRGPHGRCGRRDVRPAPPLPSASNVDAVVDSAVQSHVTYLRAVYAVVRAMSAVAELVPLLLPQPEQPESLQDLVAEQAQLLDDYVAFEVMDGSAASSPGTDKLYADLRATREKVNEAAAVYQDVQRFAAATGTATPPGASPGAVGAAVPAPAAGAGGPSPAGPPATASAPAASAGPPAATAAPPAAAPPAAGAGAGSASGTTGDAAAGGGVVKQYETEMRKFAVQSMNMSASGRMVHHYASAAGSGSSALRRVARELRSMRTSLPVNFGSAVLVRHDKARPYMLKAVIFGPEDTPYSGGAFVFDILCGDQYGKKPPSVNLMTTGGGSVRFNPNLYNCGKVCLSLLGTWRGGGTTEGWTPTSTLTQVLVSIQGLILVAEPYFNEPGVEASMGSAEGARQSRIASNGGYQQLRVATVRWAMTDALRSPHPGFEDAIRLHFKLKYPKILEEIAQWVKEAQRHADAGAHLRSLKAAAQEFVAELRKAYDNVTVPPAAARLLGLRPSAAGSAPTSSRPLRRGGQRPPRTSTGPGSAFTAGPPPATSPPLPAAVGTVADDTADGEGPDELALALALSAAAASTGGVSGGASPRGVPPMSMPPSSFEADLEAAMKLSMESAAAAAAAAASTTPATSSGPPPPATSFGTVVEDDALALALAASMSDAEVPAPSAAGVPAPPAAPALPPPPLRAPAAASLPPPPAPAAAQGSVPAPASTSAGSLTADERANLTAMFEASGDPAALLRVLATATSFDAALAELLQ